MRRFFAGAILTVCFCLNSIGFSSDIASLIKDLGDKEKAKTASGELAKIGKAAVPALIKVLEGNDKYSKRYAARALRGMGEEASDAIPALSKALNDLDSQTRGYAVEALGNMVNEGDQVIAVLKKAGKDSDSDVKKKATEALKKLQSSSSTRTATNGESANPSTSSAQNIVKDSISLDKGIYGIPFNATVDEILIWCKDNNVAIADNNEQALFQDINERARQIMGRKKTYQADKQSLQMLEEDVLKIMKSNGPATILNDYSAASENAMIGALIKKLEILKNPCFSYAGEKYYLKSAFPDGIQSCESPEITKTAYTLILKPKRESERMIKSGLSELYVFFYAIQDQIPKSYATLARFSDLRYSALIYGIISEKYGTPEGIGLDYFIIKYGASNGIGKFNETMSVISNDALHSAGLVLVSGEISALMWARNILLLGSMKIRNGDNGIEVDFDYRSDAFVVLYYEQKSVAQLIEQHKRAIERCEENRRKQINQDINQMREDF